SVFKDADLTAQPTPDQLTAVKDKSIAGCGDKLGEEQIKAKFTAGCLASDHTADKTTHCACAWTSLRKHLALADFLGDTHAQRFQDAEKLMVQDCIGGKSATTAVTEAPAKASFMS